MFISILMAKNLQKILKDEIDLNHLGKLVIVNNYHLILYCIITEIYIYQGL